MKSKRSSVLRQPPTSFAANDFHDFSIISHIRIIIFPRSFSLSAHECTAVLYIFALVEHQRVTGWTEEEKKNTHTQIGIQSSRKQTTRHNSK